jgi:uncharacterized RDD family membrane protein YckC
MKTLLLQRLTFLAVLPLCTMMVIAAAHAAAPPAIPDTPAHTAAPSSSPDPTAPATSPPNDSTDWQDNADSRDRVDRHDRSGWRARHDRHGRHGHGNELVNIGHDSNLPRGQSADSVVSIFGSSTSDGEAGDVVSILGDTRVTGPTSDGAVAVLGNVYIDGKVDGDAVAVLGDMELGPHAEIGGNVVAIGGTLQRDPAATVRGNVQSIFGSFGSVGWLRSWIHHCLLYGRPLALAPGLGWAWGLAFACLALYAALALLFREGLTRCVQTFEAQPGQSVLAALITMLLTPVLVVLLCVTVIGIAAVPFVVFGLLCVGLFGKAVMLAWLGQRVTGRQGTGALSHPAVAVLIGGVLVLALYLVPFIGFLVYKLLGLLGLGAVAYTLILAARAHQAAKEGPRSASAAAFGAGPSSGVSSGPPSSASSGPPSSASSGPSGSASSTPSGSAGSGRPSGASSAPFGSTGSTPPGSASAAAATGEAPPPGAAPAPDPSGPSPAPEAPRTQAPPPITASLPRAGFWIRIGALLLDVILVGFLMGVFHHGHHFELLVLATYGAVMWKLRGSTIGGIVFDLRVVRLDGREVDWETAIIRALGCFLSLAVAGLGFFWIAFDEQKQAWHDKIAGTVVVRVAKGTPLV